MTDAHPDPRGQLTVSESTVAGIRVVALRGELDHTTRDIARRALAPAADGTSSRTVADLTRLTFMDSAGINALIAAYRASADAQGWLRVAGAQPAVLRVLQLVGIDALIPCLPTVRDALEN
ncbi:STAS domain-containing protein [Streptomyces sp. NPDC093272]|uniref:STAS domain-containing protein n=1 Tax=Streptomyces sp. NPDC093272 TaxID=3154981 RepID=UPI00342F7079